MTVKRTVSGVILIDKPQGMTSQQVVSKVKKSLQSPCFNSKKAGHTGTLDPMAVGLLPICLGEATKFSHYQLDADKGYQAIIQLGQQTDTGDADGQCVSIKAVPSICDEQLSHICQQFLGEQKQIPPMYSALKKDGKKLYEYARKGEVVHREARDIVIKDLRLSKINDEQLFLEVVCSKGTYVRVLAEDIAAQLGTLGHLTMLKRTMVGDFRLEKSIALEDFIALPFDERLAYLLPIDACVQAFPALVLSDEKAERIQHGQRLNVSEQLHQVKHPDLVQPKKAVSMIEVRLFDTKNRFLGMATVESNGRLQPKKLVVF